MKIILTTLNARYTHTALSIRCLYANLHEFQQHAMMMEFTINDSIQTIAEDILRNSPDIIGIGVYIWNALEVHELMHIIKQVSPETTIIIGGPEVSYQPFRVSFDAADYITQGEGEKSFYELCKKISTGKMPKEKIIPIDLPDLKNTNLPYRYYTDEDIKNRYIYVEVSRGCPFECEFCLSSMDEKVRAFDLDRVLEEFEELWQRGARNYKFVDRTFNLNMRTANRILDFFLAKKEQYFVHFEVVPDHFPLSLREKIKQFPHGALQLEIGIQTLNPEVAENISRVLNFDKMRSNISFLENETTAHMHLDLIVGLPGESLESFGKNLDTLVSMSSCEIQIGILKKLSGTYIDRHDVLHGMIYSNIPPYDILKNNLLSFESIQIMKRFARFWDIFYNSGNFKKTISLLWRNQSTFQNFYNYSLWIYGVTKATYKISFERQGELLFNYLIEQKNYRAEEVAEVLLQDMTKLKGRAVAHYLKPFAKNFVIDAKEGTSGFNKRQN